MSYFHPYQYPLQIPAPGLKNGVPPQAIDLNLIPRSRTKRTKDKLHMALSGVGLQTKKSRFKEDDWYLHRSNIHNSPGKFQNGTFELDEIKGFQYSSGPQPAYSKACDKTSVSAAKENLFDYEAIHTESACGSIHEACTKSSADCQSKSPCQSRPPSVATISSRNSNDSSADEYSYNPGLDSAVIKQVLLETESLVYECFEKIPVDSDSQNNIGMDGKSLDGALHAIKTASSLFSFASNVSHSTLCFKLCSTIQQLCRVVMGIRIYGCSGEAPNANHAPGELPLEDVPASLHFESFLELPFGESTDTLKQAGTPETLFETKRFDGGAGKASQLLKNATVHDKPENTWADTSILAPLQPVSSISGAIIRDISAIEAEGISTIYSRHDGISEEISSNAESSHQEVAKTPGPSMEAISGQSKEHGFDIPTLPHYEERAHDIENEYYTVTFEDNDGCEDLEEVKRLKISLDALRRLVFAHREEVYNLRYGKKNSRGYVSLQPSKFISSAMNLLVEAQQIEVARSEGCEKIFTLTHQRLKKLRSSWNDVNHLHRMLGVQEINTGDSDLIDAKVSEIIEITLELDELLFCAIRQAGRN